MLRDGYRRGRDQIRRLNAANRAKAANALVEKSETAIERSWRLFHSVIPADSAGHGRQRTSYFYRLQAITWARMAREYGWFDAGRFRDTAISIAKSYLKTFREMKGAQR